MGAKKLVSIRKTAKVSVVGEGGVGKTRMITNFLNLKDQQSVDAMWSETKVRTVGIHFSEIAWQKMNFVFWDFAGQHRYGELREKNLKGSDGCILVYDITRRLSYDEAISYFLKEIIESNEPFPLVIIGNKNDLREIYEKYLPEFIDTLYDVLYELKKPYSFKVSRPHTPTQKIEDSPKIEKRVLIDETRKSLMEILSEKLPSSLETKNPLLAELAPTFIPGFVNELCTFITQDYRKTSIFHIKNMLVQSQYFKTYLEKNTDIYELSEIISKAVKKAPPKTKNELMVPFEHFEHVFAEHLLEALLWKKEIESENLLYIPRNFLFSLIDVPMEIREFILKQAPTLLYYDLETKFPVSLNISEEEMIQALERCIVDSRLLDELFKTIPDFIENPLIGCAETSAKTGVNVEKIFVNILSGAFNYSEQKELKKPLVKEEVDIDEWDKITK